MTIKIKEKIIIVKWLERLEKIFFSLFLLSIPLQTRLTFPTVQTYQNGTFNEYAAFFIYLSDVFLLITLFIYFVNRLAVPRLFSAKTLLYNTKKYFLTKDNDEDSNYKDNLTNNRIISLVINKLSTSPQLIPIILLSIFVLWSFFSLIWARYQDIALYRSFKLFELLLLFVYLNKRFYWFGKTRLFAIVFISGVAESIIGILQYLYQHSLGLKFLGESVIAPNIDNVAKIIIDGNRIIRAYGTFPHPNIFAAFLILSIFSGIWLLLSFRSRNGYEIVSRETISVKAMESETFLNKAKQNKTVSFRLSLSLSKLFHVKQFESVIMAFCLSFLTIGVILQIYALMLTYSRLAWLGAVIVIVLFIYLNKRYKLFHVKQFDYFVSKSSSSNCDMAMAGTRKTILSERSRVKQFIKDNLSNTQKTSLTLIMISIIVLAGLNWNKIILRTIDTDRMYKQSINTRLLYNDIALSIINSHSLLGIGNGNFTLIMNEYSNKTLGWWQYQPVHNIYLLITSELGIIGIIFFILFLLSIIVLSSRSIFIKLFHVKQLNNTASNSSFLTSLIQNAFLFKKVNQIVSRETISVKATEGETISLKNFILSILIVFLFMGLFDHYFWTLQQGQLVFWLVLGVLLALNNKDINTTDI